MASSMTDAEDSARSRDLEKAQGTTPGLAPSLLESPTTQDGRDRRSVPRISTDLSALDPKGLIGLFRNSSLTPPSTPPNKAAGDSSSRPAHSDRLNLDYQETDKLGTGLWSNVYSVEVTFPEKASVSNIAGDLPTPPVTPQRTRGSAQPQVYAAKVASRPDAKEVLKEEARILAHLHLVTRASNYIVPFFGLYNSSSTLILHRASSDLASFSTNYTSPTSLPALLDIYALLAPQLATGLAYLHDRHVIHADIKPANILLDFPGPTARYCDFSASSIHDTGPADTRPLSALPSSRPHSLASPVVPAGGGTWTFMAPELLASNPAASAPSYAADVYALGVTLLVLLLGGASPFRELDGNVFRLREAVKTGAPVQFARGDAGLGKRLRALEGEERGRRAVQRLGLALRKKPCDRVSAREWAEEES